MYLVGAREVMEAHLDPAQANRPDYALDRYGAIAPAGLAPDTLQQIGTALAGAAHPVIVTSDLGRDPAAVPALVELAKLLAIPVIESVSMRLNFPADHPLHAGYQWNTPEQNPVLAAADVVRCSVVTSPGFPPRTGRRETPGSSSSTSIRSRNRCRSGTCPRRSSPAPTCVSPLVN